MNSYLSVLKQYADFSGRTRREEYWVFVLYNLTIAICAILLDNIFRITMGEAAYGPLYGLYALATFIPGLAVAVRRLHDVGKSGWMILIGLIPIIGTIWLLVLLLSKGEEGENLYGEDPIDDEIVPSFGDEIVALLIVFYCMNSAFWGIMPKMEIDFFQSNTQKIGAPLLNIIGGLLPIYLACFVKNGSRRIFVLVLAVLLLLYDFYLIATQVR